MLKKNKRIKCVICYLRTVDHHRGYNSTCVIRQLSPGQVIPSTHWLQSLHFIIVIVIWIVNRKSAIGQAHFHIHWRLTYWNGTNRQQFNLSCWNALIIVVTIYLMTLFAQFCVIYDSSMVCNLWEFRDASVIHYVAWTGYECIIAKHSRYAV